MVDRFTYLLSLDCFLLLECDSCVIARQGCEVSVKEVDRLLSVLIEKKRKMEQEEAETNMQILQDFLHCLRKQKLEELSQVLELEFVFMGFYR